MDEILKRLRDVCAQTCGESTDEWCETHRTCLECRTDLVDALEKELDGWVELPRDADGVPIRPGDRVEGLNGEHADANFVSLLMDGTFEVGSRGWVPHLLRHAEPDTWERIITDALRAIPDEAAIAELVERCERLAGGRA